MATILLQIFVLVIGREREKVLDNAKRAVTWMQKLTRGGSTFIIRCYSL